jgi:hypothetical protein
VPNDIDSIYAKAARVTGRPAGELRKMGLHVFASMLLHAMEHPTDVIWTAASIDNSRGPGRVLDVEVSAKRPTPAAARTEGKT